MHAIAWHALVIDRPMVTPKALPRTAAEAKQMAADNNAAAATRRARADQAHRDRTSHLRQTTLTARASVRLPRLQNPLARAGASTSSTCIENAMRRVEVCCDGAGDDGYGYGADSRGPAAFEGCRGDVAYRTRSLDGFHAGYGVASPPFTDGVPLPMLAVVNDDLELRISPFTTVGVGHLSDLPMIVALWRPAVTFDRSHVVTPDGQAAVAAAIAAMMPPSVLVDAGPEVWAAWTLDAPVRDQAAAVVALRDVALKAGADVDVLSDLHAFTLPLAGPIRNWNRTDLEFIRVEHVDETARYPLSAILSAAKGKRR